jgi:hypothetical protein
MLAVPALGVYLPHPPYAPSSACTARVASQGSVSGFDRSGGSLSTPRAVSPATRFDRARMSTMSSSFTPQFQAPTPPQRGAINAFLAARLRTASSERPQSRAPPCDGLTLTQGARPVGFSEHAPPRMCNHPDRGFDPSALVRTFEGAKHLTRASHSLDKSVAGSACPLSAQPFACDGATRHASEHECECGRVPVDEMRCGTRTPSATARLMAVLCGGSSPPMASDGSCWARGGWRLPRSALPAKMPSGGLHAVRSTMPRRGGPQAIFDGIFLLENSRLLENSFLLENRSQRKPGNPRGRFPT